MIKQHVDVGELVDRDIVSIAREDRDAVAVVMQLVYREDPRMDWWALLSPFLLLVLPYMAFTAALAVLFETIRWLRGGLGNVVYFLFYIFVIMLLSFGFYGTCWGPLSLSLTVSAPKCSVPSLRLFSMLPWLSLPCMYLPGLSPGLQVDKHNCTMEVVT